MDWESDPELKALREEFVDSLTERCESLVLRISEGNAIEIRMIAHNLAGASGTYGFTRLGDIATVMDDYLSMEKSPIPKDRLERFSQYLLGEIRKAESTRKDIGRPGGEIFRELTSCVRSLASAAKS